METRSETPRETWLKPIVALLGEGDFGEAYALAAYFPNTRNRQLVQLAALLGQNKVTEASDLLGGLSRSWIRMMIKEPQEMSESVTQILVAEFATILSQVDLNLLETAYKAIENRYFQLADFCIQFQLLTHPETSLSVIGERLRKTEFVQDINLDVKGEPAIKVPPGKLAGGEADLNRIYPIRGRISKCGEFNRRTKHFRPIKPRRPPNSLTIERHTRIEFPSECVLEQKVDLKIQLTQEIPEFTRVLEKILLTVGLNTKQVKLSVKVTAPAFAIRPYQRQLTVPVMGDSNEVTFTLVPLERGEQVIEIEFFKGATRVGYVLLPANVVPYSYNKISPKVLSMEDPIDGLKNLESMTVNPDKHTLNVTWIERESKLLYTIFPANRLGEWEKTIPNIQDKIEDDLRSLNAFLTEVVQQGNPSDERWESICFNLQSVGSNLFEMLIPSEVAKQMRTWKIGSPVIISTNEQWIPWELMYDGEDFWGKKFIIARSPRLRDSQDLPDKNRPESKGERKIKRIVNIVGGDVPSSEAERATHLFSNLLPPEAVHLLAKQPISSLVKAIPGTDALHFTCHGHLEPHLLQIAGDKNKTRIENLLPETIQRLPLEPGSLVFANACASTVPVLTFGKFSSFGWKFYQRGADAFIGTLGAVPVKYAVNFAEIVYRELFNPDEKITIGQAVAKAKEVAANERNLFWLLYCIYGDPDFSIVQQKNSKEEDHAN
ncbi:MAG: CHAT domain-containing protein [Microcystis aeruginosa G13-09]|nr:CHAT domain-containing protein [Microcystis aeruginosa G13-09]